VEYEVLVSPNPAGAEASAFIAVPRAARVTMLVQDLTGQSLWSTDLGYLAPGHRTEVLPAGRWASGVYFLTLSADEGLGLSPRKTFKFAIAR
jgi:hypothetical protein